MSDDVKVVAQEILDRTADQIGTHFIDCHKYHLACFAAFVMRALEASVQAPAVQARQRPLNEYIAGPLGEAIRSRAQQVREGN